CVSNTASFFASATGVPAPSIQWQVSPNGVSYSDIPGATTTTLAFTALSSDNGKSYRAQFSNTCGSATSVVAVLTVLTPPAIAIVAETNVCVSSTGNAASVSNAPAGSAYAWTV